VEAFPALLKERSSGTSGEALIVDDEASCFYHPKKKAVIPCGSCGRFLCSLCDVEFNGRHLCPSCLARGKRKGKIKNLQNHRILYDNIALSFAFIPILAIWPTILTAPISLFLVIRYWNAPTSIVPRNKWRFVLAFIIAGLQIVGWSFVFFS
jgi:hypothetical protein